MLSKSRFFLIVLFYLFAQNSLKAQYVTIPDPIFANWLQQIIPNAMNGNQMDTTHVSVTSLSVLSVNSLSISSLDGVQYFDSLLELNCVSNNLYSLPSLPTTLEHLYCAHNHLSSLPSLPASLIWLDCNENQITSLPELPQNLYYFYCGHNQLTSLPDLPPALLYFGCSWNQLTSIPTLPNSLRTLGCDWNFTINTLPSLPNTLTHLSCVFNALTQLPALPSTLISLDCGANQITSLPPLPDSLVELYFGGNPIYCLPLIPSSVTDFSIPNCSCIPNETQYFNQQTTGLPLCTSYNPVTNPNNCESFLSVIGTTYKDTDINCHQSLGESALRYVPLLLKDNATGDTIAQTYSWLDGTFGFSGLNGDYTAFIDTLALASFADPTCSDSAFSVILGQPMPALDLGLHCGSGFDIGTVSVVSQGMVFPGEMFSLRTIAGDVSSLIGMNCLNSGISGQVEVIVNGPVTYVGNPVTALIPTVSGNTYTYSVSDFSTLNSTEDFVLNFLTETTAQSGDTVSVLVTVTTNQVGDNNLWNNTFSHSFIVGNSYDPNMKEVYPVDVLPGYDDYFTYTIHFQNMGSAPAINIRLADTLDSHLDLSTFEVLSYSHNNEIHRIGNELYVRFPNINLVSNTVDEEASKGYIQYRIKPYPNQPNGTVIPNTAYIYFDYNPAVITNTTENQFLQDLSVKNPTTAPLFYVYPNPSNGNFTIQTQQEQLGSVLRVTDVSGKIIQETMLTSTIQTVSTVLENGVYVILLENPATGTMTQKRLVVSK